MSAGRRAAALVAAACALAPAAAQGATVGVGPGAPTNGGGGDVFFQGPDVLTFAAAPGETNQVTVTLDADALVVSDPGGQLAAGDGCTLVDPQTARCSPLAQPIGVLQAFLEDGDDTLTSTAAPSLQRAEVSAGAGDDVVLTGGSADVLRGEDGADRLESAGAGDLLDGGPGADALFAGDGDDVLLDPDAAGVDVLDGGGGTDEASFAGRATDVDARLEREATADGDRLVALEALRGGSGDDLLDGAAGPNTLTGGDGDDELRGRGGNDRLVGELGGDLAICGGGGTDVVVDPDGRVPPECERLELPFAGGSWKLRSRPVKQGRTGATFRVGCPFSDPVSPIGPLFKGCTGTLTIREAGGRARLIGRARLTGSQERPEQVVKITYTTAGRALLARGARRVDVLLRGELPRTRWEIELGDAG